mmetsp:Transcript_30022/g.96315  ORF Transcript_30022/g.96315 Transcript_30022/m.96315 type:complete len:729 (-) Transcript_30022:1238-3424(-)
MDADAWPPLYEVTEDKTIFFPLELTDFDYGNRVLGLIEQGLGEVHVAMVELSLATPVVSDGVLVPSSQVSLSQLLRHLEDAHVAKAFSSRMLMDEQDFREMMKRLQQALASMSNKSKILQDLNHCQTDQLFDLGLQILGAGSRASLCCQTSQQLLQLKTRWTRHRSFRQERMKRLMEVLPSDACGPCEEQLVKLKKRIAKLKSLPAFSHREQLDHIWKRVHDLAEERSFLSETLYQSREEERYHVRAKKWDQAQMNKHAQDLEMLPRIEQVSEKLAEVWASIRPAELQESEERAGYRECIEEFVERRDYVSANEMSRRLEDMQAMRDRQQANTLMARLFQRAGERGGVIRAMTEVVKRSDPRSLPDEPLFDEDLLVFLLDKQLEVLRERSRTWRLDYEADPAQVLSSSQTLSRHVQQVDELIARVENYQALLSWRLSALERLQEAEEAVESMRAVVEELLVPSHGKLSRVTAARILEHLSFDLSRLRRLLLHRDSLLALADDLEDASRGGQKPRHAVWGAEGWRSCKGWMMTSIGGWGKDEGNFKSPCGLAFSPTGQVLVADRGNHRVQILSDNGRVLKAFASRGSGDGELESPSGVAVSEDGRVLVADRGNNRISVFNMEGRWLYHIGNGTGVEAGEMQGPCGVATSRRNEVLVADCGNHRVQVFTLDGNLKRIMGEGLRYPICVAARKSGEVLVTERGGSSVKVLSPDGRLVASLPLAASRQTRNE